MFFFFFFFFGLLLIFDGYVLTGIRYLELVRTIIKRYTLEPAGSHGVWGLDDHSFMPYIFGAAQYAPAMSESDPVPEEGSLPDAPDPGGVAKANIVERERKTNMYFSAVGFIYDVKRGPFWEHSPMLFDISGVRAGWGKINKVGFHPRFFDRYTANTDSELRACLKCTTQKSSPNSPLCSIFPSARYSVSTPIQTPFHPRTSNPRPTLHKHVPRHHQAQPQNREPRLPGQRQQRHLQRGQLRRGQQQKARTQRRETLRHLLHPFRTRRDYHRALWPQLGRLGRILRLAEPHRVPIVVPNQPRRLGRSSVCIM